MPCSQARPYAPPSPVSPLTGVEPDPWVMVKKKEEPAGADSESWDFDEAALEAEATKQ